MKKCLYCYKELKKGQTDYHPACAKKIFNTKHAPVLPYKRSQINELAQIVIRAQTTLTGVQSKLSLDIKAHDKNEPDRFTIVGLWGTVYIETTNGELQMPARIRGSYHAYGRNCKNSSCAAFTDQI